MTVLAKVPIAEYNGNGVITEFAWDWDMIADSSIHAIIDNIIETGFNVQGNSVVFDTAPANGAEIKIYRRTILHMPEIYLPFERYPSAKNELSMDRIVMICQERAGFRASGNAPDGIVGGADLYSIRAAFSHTIVSEKGTDAVIPMWSDGGEPVDPPPGDPDATIVWGGALLEVGRIASGFSSASIRFRMDLTGGDPAKGSAEYPNYSATTYVDWLDHDPVDDEYWMRVTEVGGPQAHTFLNDGDSYIPLGSEFEIRGSTLNPLLGPFVGVDTTGISVGAGQAGRVATFLIEISKAVAGVPDGNWASRTVQVEAIETP